MSEDISEITKKHLELLHTLSHIDVCQLWIDLLKYYTDDLKRKDGMHTIVLDFLAEHSKGFDPAKEKKPLLYLRSYILDDGLRLHRVTHARRWTTVGTQDTKLPSKSPENKGRKWFERIPPRHRYIINTILNDIEDLGLFSECDHFIQLYAYWAHTIPADHVIKSQDFNKIKEADADKFAIGTSWENEDISEKKIQYYVENWDYRGIYDTLVMLGIE